MRPVSTRMDKLFHRTLDGLHAAGQARDASGVSGLRAKASFAAWMILRTATHSQASGHRVSAVARLCLWQLWRKLPRAGAIAQLSDGERLWCPPWSHLAAAWLSVGDHEAEIPFVRALLRPGDRFVDVGANIGVYSVVAGVRGARVLAFEPNGTARAMLAANLTLNHIEDRVQVLSYALADFSGPARFTTDLESSNHLEVDSEAKGEVVEVRKLDALLEPGDRVTVIKIDAEGFDEAVLRGGRGALERERPVVIAETWAGAESLRKFLGALGYDFFLYEYALRPLPPDFQQDANLIAIHSSRVDWVRERLRTARSEKRRGPRARWVFREDWPRSV
jgi:FkbM family methyltransferase